MIERIALLNWPNCQCFSFLVVYKIMVLRCLPWDEIQCIYKQAGFQMLSHRAKLTYPWGCELPALQSGKAEQKLVPKRRKIKEGAVLHMSVPSSKLTGQIESLFLPEGMERAQECVIPMEWPPHGRKYQKREEVSPRNYLIGLMWDENKFVICLLAFSVVDEKFDASLILIILSMTYFILLPYLFQEDFIFSLALVFWNSKKVCPGVGLYFSFTLLRILFALKFWN